MKLIEINYMIGCILIIIILSNITAFGKFEEEHKCGSLNQRMALAWGDKKIDGYVKEYIQEMFIDTNSNIYSLGKKIRPETTLKDNEQDSIYTVDKIDVIEKRNKEGELLWSTLYHPYYRSNLRAGAAFTNGDIIFAGGYYSTPLGDSYSVNMNLILLDSNGSRIKNKILYLEGGSKIYDIGIYNDSLIYICGRTRSGVGISNDILPSFSDQQNYGFIMCFDKDLNKVWGEYIKSKGASDYQVNKVNHLDIDSKGNVAIVISSKNLDLTHGYEKYKNSGNMYIRKYNKQGDLLWSKIYYESEVSESIKDLKIDSNDEILIFSSSSYGGPTDLNTRGEASKGEIQNTLISKLDSDGVIIWSQYSSMWNDSGENFCQIDGEDNFYRFSIFQDIHNTDEEYKNIDSCRMFGSNEDYSGYNLTKYNKEGKKIYNYKITQNNVYIWSFQLTKENEILLRVARTGGIDFDDKKLKNYESYGILKYGIDEIKILDTENKETCTNEEFELSLEPSYEDIEASIWVELSDKNGSFDSPVSISNTITEFEKIDCKVPSVVGSGKDYKLRINSNNDQLNYSYNSFKLSINKSPSSEIISEIDSVCIGGTYSYETEGQPTVSSEWEVIGGELISEPNEHTVEIKWEDKEDLQLILRQINENDCSESKTYNIPRYSEVEFEYYDTIRICQGESLYLDNNVGPLGGYYSGEGIENDTLNSADLEPGAYSFTYTKDIPCENYETFTFQILENPEKPMIKMDEKEELYVEGGETYSWFMKVDTLLEEVGEGQRYKPIVNGQYIVRAENKNGCKSEFSTAYDFITSIDELDETEYEISIKSNTIMVSFNRIIPKGLINIYDIKGSRIKSLEIGGRRQLNIENISKGVMIIELQTERKHIKKIILNQ